MTSAKGGSAVSSVARYRRWCATLQGLLILTLGLIPRVLPGQAEPAASALEVRIAPGSFLIANRARQVGLGYEGLSPYYDLVVQAIYFVNRGASPLTLEEARIDVLAQGEVLQATTISMDEIARAQAKAAAIANMNFPVALDIYYSASLMMPEGIVFAATKTLAPATAAVVDDNYLIVRSLPEEVRVTARAVNEAGEAISGVGSIPVRQYESHNDFILPVEPGEWFILAYPGLEGHHRWAAATEHAYDITRVDARGSWAEGAASDWRTGRVAEWERWYAYGKKVLAAADGVVLKVVDDVEFPLDFWNRQEGESLEDYRRRIGAKQMELFLAPGADPEAVAGGNHILIEHRGGEYSYYAHLAHGSIQVRVGDRVVQGQPIAGLGGTGEIPAVHLHFQVTDSPSLTAARTLPVEFTNVEVNEQFVDEYAPEIVFQPGFFVTASAIGN